MRGDLKVDPGCRPRDPIPRDGKDTPRGAQRGGMSSSPTRGRQGSRPPRGRPSCSPAASPSPSRMRGRAAGTGQGRPERHSQDQGTLMAGSSFSPSILIDRTALDRLKQDPSVSLTNINLSPAAKRQPGRSRPSSEATSPRNGRSPPRFIMTPDTSFRYPPARIFNEPFPNGSAELSMLSLPWYGESPSSSAQCSPRTSRRTSSPSPPPSRLRRDRPASVLHPTAHQSVCDTPIMSPKSSRQRPATVAGLNHGLESTPWFVGAEKPIAFASSRDLLSPSPTGPSQAIRLPMMFCGSAFSPPRPAGTPRATRAFDRSRHNKMLETFVEGNGDATSPPPLAPSLRQWMAM
ncbi:hypothetical protein CYMTET_32278 [Cymbomonas tetramitiformis]|uniref:Uncharacterized protein n=1 Tax=Cymbomonas tetramitiformis TaxID=36881 RepID=A0AAE0FFE3_9CHLO|nr:hypothetical protein CYMTET_32278 [Cymbomonas tetramitiformis]